MSRPLLTVAEVATRVRTEPITIIRLCRAKKIRATKPGRSWLISEEALDEYLLAHSNMPQQESA